MFQSTHSRGVRQNRVTGKFSFERFNPRTHEECDISLRIHKRIDRSFNPRTHEECDIRSSMLASSLDCFNPRTHEECDN